MAEGDGLLNRYTGNPVSRVRIPLPPPPLSCIARFIAWANWPCSSRSNCPRFCAGCVTIFSTRPRRAADASSRAPGRCHRRWLRQRARRRVQSHPYLRWRWHLDEVFVRSNGETHYLWRAVDHEGKVLEVFAPKRRDRKAVLKFLKRAMKQCGQPKVIVTDRLRSYRAAMNVIGNGADQECGRWLNNCAENSHQPFRRREGAMSKFRDVKTLQKFAAVHASTFNHFNLDRHLNSRSVFKQNRSAALAEWRQLAA